MIFRLHYSGNKPNWGIAFRNPSIDVPAVFQNNQPKSIDIQFFQGPIYTCGIRSSFWTGCYEFMDTNIQNRNPMEDLFIRQLGFTINNCGICNIEVTRQPNLSQSTNNIVLQINKIEI